jgi:hypothetical protein
MVKPQEVKLGIDKRKVLDWLPIGYDDVGWVKMAQDCGPEVASCEQSNGIFGFNKSRTFLKWMRNSAFQGRPCTRKSGTYFSSNSQYLHRLPLFPPPSHYKRRQKKNTSYRPPTVNKVLARNHLFELLFLIHSDIQLCVLL